MEAWESSDAKASTKDKFIFEDQRPTGFTLVELLVVLALVSVLAALLSPAMAQAKARAQAAVCRSHIKRLQLAWLNCAYDHEDQLPPNRIDSLRGYPESFPGSWVVGNATVDLTAPTLSGAFCFLTAGRLPWIAVLRTSPPCNENRVSGPRAAIP